MIDVDGKAFHWDENALSLLAKNCDSYSQYFSRDEATLLPDVPSDILEWNYTCRPVIKGVQNRIKYLPMIVKVLQDQHPLDSITLG